MLCDALLQVLQASIYTTIVTRRSAVLKCAAIPSIPHHPLPTADTRRRPHRVTVTPE
jgi:hypothetical protein